MTPLLKNIGPKDTSYLKEKLTAMQYYVTQENGMEPPFQNEYWDCNLEGLYVDIISGEPLFSSKDKFNTGSGRPIFRKPVMFASVTEREGNSGIEVRSRESGSYLGRRFPSYYEVNSAALRFIRKENLEREGYGDFLILFQMK